MTTRLALAAAALALAAALPAQPASRPLRAGPPDAPARLLRPPSPDPARAPSAVRRPAALDQALTRRYLEQYATPQGLAWLQAVMERGAPYVAFIRREIAALGLPGELVYLPVVESQFLPTALSKSGASGLWQFMTNSIAPFGMRVDEWIDERRDFWKATQGALRKLRDNHERYGDWDLALAAYNAGAGAVDQALRRAGPGAGYWDLAARGLLSVETAHFVPKFLAVAEILSDPLRYGASPLWPDDPGWTRVPVPRQADLGLIAGEAGLDEAALRRANAELLYGVTPPAPGYALKVPAADVEAVAAVLSRTDRPLVRYYIHAIRSGDTLSALAVHYGVSVELILEHNPGVKARALRIGARLMIPAFKDVGPYAPERKTAANPGAFTGTHVVVKGETLWSIALAFDVDPETLAEVNGMGLNDVLRVGRALKTPVKPAAKP